VSCKDYVAGCLDSSIHDSLGALPRTSEKLKYALITCLDSDLNPGALLKTSPHLQSVASKAKPLQKGLLVPTKLLLQADSHDRLFFGFDEVWFFPTENIEPKPDSGWLVGPARIDQNELDKLGAWMTANSCSLALGDGQGLNFIIKARGLVKHLLGHSIDQAEPNATFVASNSEQVVGGPFGASSKGHS